MLLILIFSIKRKAETSLLLRLPLEVKRKIYINVLGNRKIHIQTSEATDVHGDAPVDFASLLASSRQIYVEANTIFWSTNTFTFMGPSAFATWMKARNRVQKEAIRSLGFVMDLTNQYRKWEKVFSERVFKQLPGFVDLQLEIHLFVWWCEPMSLDDEYRHEPRLDAVRTLAVLPLKTVDVRILPNLLLYGSRPAPWCTENTFWTKSERLYFADLLKRELLAPSLAGIAANIEAEQVSKAGAESQVKNDTQRGETGSNILQDSVSRSHESIQIAPAV